MYFQFELKHCTILVIELRLLLTGLMYVFTVFHSCWNSNLHLPYISLIYPYYTFFIYPWFITPTHVCTYRLTHSSFHSHKPLKKINWLSAITRLTAHITCGLVSDLVIYKHKKELWSDMTPMFLLRPCVLKAPSWEPAVCCCVVVAAAYTHRGGRPGPPKCGFK